MDSTTSTSSIMAVVVQANSSSLNHNDKIVQLISTIFKTLDKSLAKLSNEENNITKLLEQFNHNAETLCCDVILKYMSHIIDEMVNLENPNNSTYLINNDIQNSLQRIMWTSVYSKKLSKEKYNEQDNRSIRRHIQFIQSGINEILESVEL